MEVMFDIASKGFYVSCYQNALCYGAGIIYGPKIICFGCELICYSM